MLYYVASYGHHLAICCICEVNAMPDRTMLANVFFLCT